MATEEAQLRIPRVDLTGLRLEHVGTARWDAAREEVARALESYGCFDAVYDGVGPELLRTLFGKGAKELFGLPLETKRKNSAGTPYHGYIGQLPGLDYESLALEDAEVMRGAERFTRLMWPDGNPEFRDTLCSFAKKLVELDRLVQKMILESLGADKYFDSHIDTTKYLLRLAEYRAPQTSETIVCMPEHTDHSFVTIICQDQVSGLEILTKNRDWITVRPSPDSFTIMTGDAFEAWSNGRLVPPRHRVVLNGGNTRYSSILCSFRKDGHLVQAPNELVDKEHPMLFKPYLHGDYLNFCITEAGYNAQHRLRAFCGLGEKGEEV
ncbi:probable 2-oxoglutarate-dependent dioxygenase AOP1 [Phoenix dactylifera]|uniref:2-oxoglutarate-dependent dioxygenase DAO n=1 Tax=Phoenix dactylifera TaxID=42345 RepID=A0A8B7C948_PHODC|nr:probable 2-oxoglutarate-dependent dioxygenase AOP1 [Phoenix dactylifera]